MKPYSVECYRLQRALGWAYSLSVPSVTAVVGMGRQSCVLAGDSDVVAVWWGATLLCTLLHNERTF